MALRLRNKNSFIYHQYKTSNEINIIIIKSIETIKEIRENFKI